jgi:hypothetical protein
MMISALGSALGLPIRMMAIVHLLLVVLVLIMAVVIL